MFAIMGSVGTIAYTRDSDYDYWVCIDSHHIQQDMMKKFIKKVEAIQNWAADEIKFEVHMFINDINRIKNNIFAESDEEAFGSTTGAVLKDEFFRSSIIISGKVPFWWVIPRFVTDEEYERLFSRLDELSQQTQFIDLGNLFEISKEDFLGAALFQLIKSLGNPFKSIIKIGVLENYLFGSEGAPLLCQKLKSNILRGELNNTVIDSYILMFQEVYRYYEKALDDPVLLKILRQNLYLKINPQLSRYMGIKDTKNLPYKVLVMFKYVKAWGWSLADISELDDFDNWDYSKLMVFWNHVKKFMLLSYQKISGEMRTMDLKQKISESDFMLLSRKIRSHFTTEPNKIDYYVTFKDTPHESIIYIEPTNKSINEFDWNLSKRKTSAEDKFESTVIKTENNLVKLLAWSAINRIYNPTYSRFKIQSGYSRINQNLVVELMSKIWTLFIKNAPKLKNEYFLKESFNLINMVIINFGIENADTLQNCYHLYQTSWAESYLDEYRTSAEMPSILEKVLQGGLCYPRPFDEHCAVITPEPFKKIYKEIENVFKESYNFITQSDKKTSARYTTYMCGLFLSVTRDSGRIQIESDTDENQLMMKISLRPKKDIIHQFSKSDARLDVYNEMFKLCRANTITIFYRDCGNIIIIHVVNERGNLFSFIKSKSLKDEATVCVYDFCKNIIKRLNGSNAVHAINQKTPVYKISTDKFGKTAIENITNTIDGVYLVRFKDIHPLRSTVFQSSGRENAYMLSPVGEKNKTAVSLAETPEKILMMKREIPGLDFFITEIDFSGDIRENNLPGTTPYFLEKYRLELIIDKALKIATQ
jgi:adenylate cyclase class 1